jgi:hypothetical protein
MTKLIFHRQQQEAQYYTENLGEGINLNMMLIPSDSFQMGTPDIEAMIKISDGRYLFRQKAQK